MKVKLVRHENYNVLVVADPKINALYTKKDTQKDRPIELANTINYFHSGVYSVADWRLSQHRMPSPYLEGSTMGHYTPKDEEMRQFLISNLHTYREDKEGLFHWDTFDLHHFEGDNPDCRSKYGEQYSINARFTYKAAKEKLAEIREFWENWDDPDLSKARIINPYRQISESAVMSREIIRQMQADGTINGNSKKKNKP